MKRKDKGITDEKLQDLTRAVAKLVAITTTDLNEIRASLEELSEDVGVIGQRHDGLAADVEELRALEPTFTISGTDITAAGPTLTDVFVAELDAEAGDKPYELRETKNLYVSGGNPYAVARTLIQAAQDEAIDPTFLQLSVAWEAGDEDEESYFAGNIAAVV
jgi:hypothetical protein